MVKNFDKNKHSRDKEGKFTSKQENNIRCFYFTKNKEKIESIAKLNNKQKLNIIAEHQNGKSLAELSKVYGVSKTAISKILKNIKSLRKIFVIYKLCLI